MGDPSDHPASDEPAAAAAASSDPPTTTPLPSSRTLQSGTGEELTWY